MGRSKELGKQAQTKPVKKSKRKRKNGVIRQIRSAQNSTNMLNSRASFERVVREMVADMSAKPGMRLDPGAISALQVAAESALIELMASANKLAVELAGRQGPLLKDFKAAVSFCKHFH